MLNLIGRGLIAFLFLAGGIQKLVSPAQGHDLLAMYHLPHWLLWPAIAFNLSAGLALLSGIAVRWVALSLALYCMITSLFHFQLDDGWQMSIFVKNWAIAGGLLLLFETTEKR